MVAYKFCLNVCPAPVADSFVVFVGSDLWVWFRVSPLEERDRCFEICIEGYRGGGMLLICQVVAVRLLMV